MSRIIIFQELKVPNKLNFCVIFAMLLGSDADYQLLKGFETFPYQLQTPVLGHNQLSNRAFGAEGYGKTYNQRHCVAAKEPVMLFASFRLRQSLQTHPKIRNEE